MRLQCARSRHQSMPNRQRRAARNIFRSWKRETKDQHGVSTSRNFGVPKDRQALSARATNAARGLRNLALRRRIRGSPRGQARASHPISCSSVGTAGNEGAIYSPDGMHIQFDDGRVWQRDIGPPSPVCSAVRQWSTAGSFKGGQGRIAPCPPLAHTNANRLSGPCAEFGCWEGT
jgi:hypothetical protein